ncbi:MAG: HAMP domain-containing histidine kinase [Epsilonproteobacteria bacterium]|nr:HAMP domain-containing histidine kinase [Campylobacterota bacterium]
MEIQKINKNLFYLLLSFAVGIFFIIIIHMIFVKFATKLDKKIENLRNRLVIDKLLLQDIHKIRSAFFELSVTTRDDKGRQIVLKRIRKIEKDIRNSLKVLQNGGILKRRAKINVAGHKSMMMRIRYQKNDDELCTECIYLMPKLSELNKRLVKLIENLKKRERLFYKDGKTDELKKTVQQIRMNNKRVPAFFDRIYENIQRVIYEKNLELKNIEEAHEKNKRFYELAEIISILITSFIVLVFVYIVSKQIKDSGEYLYIKVQEEVEKSRLKDRQLLQQSRLAQMGEMLSMIAHQWRQPLTAISAASGSLLLKAKLNKIDNEIVMDSAEKISSYSQYLSSTIDDFRDFFKSNKEKKETNFNILVDSVLSIIETSIKNKNISLRKDLSEKNSFMSYPDELKQVIMNLIKNAEDVLLDKNIQNPTIFIRTYENDESFILEVEDNAGGVPQEILSKIFDPYFSTKLEKDGTGLGLYMSKMIVEEHCNGKLLVENGQNGAIFRIVIKK